MRKGLVFYDKQEAKKFLNAAINYSLKQTWIKNQYPEHHQKGASPYVDNGYESTAQEYNE